MSKIRSLLIIVIFASCNFETPIDFSEKALNEKIVSVNNSSYIFNDVLHQYKGKKVFISFWASWCRDCLIGLPKVQLLQDQFPEVVFLFLSVDERNNAWKKAIDRYNLKGEHYNLPNGMKNGDIVDFIGLGWIPRYMVIDENGKIILFKATNAAEAKLIEALKF